MPLGALSLAWTQAEAWLPAGWVISALVLNGINGCSSDVRPPTPYWEATAAADEDADPDAECFGYGATPHQALTDLARNLAEIRGSTNG